MSDALLELEELSVRYGDARACDGVDLDTRANWAGERTGFLGDGAEHGFAGERGHAADPGQRNGTSDEGRGQAQKTSPSSRAEITAIDAS